MICFDFNGVEISADDFPKTLQGSVAFSIAFAGNAHCSNKDAAIELLMHQAEEIIQQVKTGQAP